MMVGLAARRLNRDRVCCRGRRRGRSWRSGHWQHDLTAHPARQKRASGHRCALAGDEYPQTTDQKRPDGHAGGGVGSAFFARPLQIYALPGYFYEQWPKLQPPGLSDHAFSGNCFDLANSRRPPRNDYGRSDGDILGDPKGKALALLNRPRIERINRAELDRCLRRYDDLYGRLRRLRRSRQICE